MMLPVMLSDEATFEFNEAIDWYDQQDPGRGDHFDEAVHSTLTRIGEQPLLHPMIFDIVRSKRVPATHTESCMSSNPSMFV